MELKEKIEQYTVTFTGEEFDKLIRGLSEAVAYKDRLETERREQARAYPTERKYHEEKAASHHAEGNAYMLLRNDLERVRRP